jgi:hypothetical protein
MLECPQVLQDRVYFSSCGQRYPPRSYVGQVPRAAVPTHARILQAQERMATSLLAQGNRIFVLCLIS